MIRLCGKCGSRNDPKRVICQDCGVGLPDPQPDGGQSVVPPVAYQPPPPVFKGSKKEYAALKSVQPRHLVRNLVLVVLLCLAGMLAWAVTKALQPIPGPRPPVPANASTVAHLEDALFKASAFGRGNWVGETGALNQFLAEKARPRPLFEVAGKELRFERCYLETGEGTLDLVMVVDAGGRSLVCRLGMVPAAKDGAPRVRFSRATIGGLEIPEIAAGYFAPLWMPCVASSGPVLKKIASAKRIEITPGAVIVQWSASSR